MSPGTDRYRGILQGERKTFVSEDAAAAAITSRWPKAFREGSTGFDCTWMCRGEGSAIPFYEGMVAHMCAKRQSDPEGPWWVRFDEPKEKKEGRPAEGTPPKTSRPSP